MLRWADRIFVMEKRHRDRIMERFGETLTDKKIIILNILDDFEYMDEELIDTLKGSLQPYLDEHLIA
jgi:protein-tyrosine phosphatase